MLDLDLPAGAELRPADGQPGALDVIRDGKTIAHVTAPATVDAQGAPVTTTARTDGDDLILDVKHRGEDYAYPLMVDPQVLGMVGYHWSDYDLRTNAAGWGTHRSCCSAQWHQEFGSARTGVRGLSTWNNTTTFSGTGIAEWNWYGTWDRAAFPVVMQEYFAFSMLGAQNSVCHYSGIFSVTRGRWVAGGVETPPAPCVSTSGYKTNWWAGPKIAGTDDYEDVGSAYAVFGTRIKTTTPGYFTNFLHSINIWVTDNNVPTISQTSFPAGWVKSGSYPVVARDPGVGVKTVRIDQTGASLNPACSFDPVNRCDTAETINVDTTKLPEGSTTITGYTADALGGSGHTRQNNAIGTLKVDRSSPSIDLPSALEDGDGGYVHRGQVAFSALATDVKTGITTAGVRSLELKVNDQRQQYFEQPCSQGCQLERELTMDMSAFTDGARPKITVVATYWAGNTTSQDFYVTVDDAEPTVTATGTLRPSLGGWLGAGTYRVDVTGRDGTATTPSSGTQRLELWVDAALVDSTEAECPHRWQLRACGFPRA